MKFQGKLFLGLFGFVALVTVIYGFWSRDESGIILLLFTACMALMIGFFLMNTARRVFPRPEDQDDGQIEDAISDYGFYSPHSWWPLPLAASKTSSSKRS